MPLNPQATSNKESALVQSRRAEDNKADRKGGAAAGAKRKYRRHPKVCILDASLIEPLYVVQANQIISLQNDENAPERPPSAYVIFSNSMCLSGFIQWQSLIMFRDSRRAETTKSVIYKHCEKGWRALAGSPTRSKGAVRVRGFIGKREISRRNG